MARRKHDFYETAPWQTQALIAHQPLSGLVLECCTGDDSITRELRAAGLTVVTNDIVKIRKADFHYDAQDPALYHAILKRFGQFPDFTISNPPYKMPICTRIIENAIGHTAQGVCMMVRISFREPTAHVHPRGPFLERNPISRALTLPRYSFTGNGKADTTTTEWLLWLADTANWPGLSPLLSLYNADVQFADTKILAADTPRKLACPA